MTVESNATWYWLRPDRQQASGSLAELRNLLAARSLPRSTLVWAEPWPEWLPASEVAALADAIPPAAPRPASEPPPRPSAPPLVRRNAPAPLHEPARSKAPSAQPPKFDPAKREAANGSLKLEPPRANGALRPAPSLKAEAFLNSLSKKPSSAKVDSLRAEPFTASDEVNAQTSARSDLPKLEARRSAAPKPLAPKSNLPKLEPRATQGDKVPPRAVAKSDGAPAAEPRAEAPAVLPRPGDVSSALPGPVHGSPLPTPHEAAPALTGPVEGSGLAEPAAASHADVAQLEGAPPVTRGEPPARPLAELDPELSQAVASVSMPEPIEAAPEVLPKVEAASVARSSLDDLESKASELETVPLAVPVDTLREPAARDASTVEPKLDDDAKFEVSARDIVKVEELPSTAVHPEEPSSPAAAFAEPSEAAPEGDRELLTLPAEHLVTEAPAAALHEAAPMPGEALGVADAKREELFASDYGVHGPASTPGFFPAQPRRALTNTDAPVELAASEEGLVPPPGRRANEGGRGAKTALWAVSSVCAVLVLALGFTVRALRSRPLETAVQSSVTAPPPKPEEPQSFQCSVLAAAAKLATSVERNIEPSVTPIDDARVAIGFASAPGEAEGIVVDLGTLDVSQAFQEKADARVAQVVASAGQPPRFAVQREALDFASARVLETEPSSELGVAPEALVIRRGAEKKVLWPLPPGHGAEPKTARQQDGSYRVVLRRGGVAGDLVTGKIGADGNAAGELSVIDAGVRMLGSPVVAANKSASFVVFAGRDQKTDPFRLRAASLSTGEPSPRAADLPIPTAEGNGALAPSLTPTADDRWLLQWTQGEVGRYRVFVQALSKELKPEGTAVAVSPMGANAGQGVVRAFGDKALSLFVLPVPGHDELWGAVLTCR
ncbi:MAG TPA: GYF domain-containing protein [Polyangiaceae bacterium]|nr:GYF domain-containing protein [Polyangiaceae bacterium]